MSETDAEIIHRMFAHLQNFLELPNPTFGGLPVCPFAQTARLQQKIWCQVYRFAPEGFDKPELLDIFDRFLESQRHDVLWVIHPDPDAMPLEALQNFVEHLNDEIAELGLVAFSGHPHESFNVQGVYTRREPYINFTVQTHKKVTEASEKLLKTRYYENWSIENLKQVGLPRTNTDSIG